MQYWKNTDENGFVTVSTINADGEGNSTKEEHDIIADMYRNAPNGCAVIETESGCDYAKIPEPAEDELDEAEALSIILGGAI